MRLGETAVVLRADGGRLRIDPIDARLNEGALHLEPELVRPADGPLRLKLGAASTLQNAVVNDEVSHRVLSYAAPVLDGATRVAGPRLRAAGSTRNSRSAKAPGRPRASRATSSSTTSGSCRGRSPRRSSTCSRTCGRPRTPATGRCWCSATRSRSASPTGRSISAGCSSPWAGSARSALEGSVDFEKHLDLVARFRDQSAPGRPAGARGALEQRPVRAADPGDARRPADRRGGPEGAAQVAGFGHARQLDRGRCRRA